ncbi:MAG: VOC family protein [Pseudomonadota bacterium]
MSTDAMQPRAADLAYLRFTAPDLDKMQTFLEDFGLTVTRSETDAGVPALYSRGTDGSPFSHVVEEGEPRFVGLGFLMSSRDDLLALAAAEGASPVHTPTEPGGGERVRFTDPHGYLIDGIYGWTHVDCDPATQRPPVNCAENRQRSDAPVRLHTGPCRVMRLGHCVLFVSDFRSSERWYKERFDFISSDEIYSGDDKDNVIGAFMRCNQGDKPVDHHTVFLLGMPDNVPGMQHAAFEVQDWDDLMVGHDHLHKAGYQHRWGIGKHIFGSQVFDYWSDPYGNMLEHFTDGDLYSASVPTAREPVELLRASQWGPTRAPIGS